MHYDIKLVAGGEENGQESGIWMSKQPDGSWDCATDEEIRSVLDKKLLFRIKGEAALYDALRDVADLDKVAVCKVDSEQPECND